MSYKQINEMLNVVSITLEIIKPLSKKEKLIFIICKIHFVHHNKHSLSGIIFTVRTTRNALKLCGKMQSFWTLSLVTRIVTTESG